MSISLLWAFLGLGTSSGLPRALGLLWALYMRAPHQTLSAENLRLNCYFISLVVREEEREKKEKEEDHDFMTCPSSGLHMEVFWSPPCLQGTTIKNQSSSAPPSLWACVTPFTGHYYKPFLNRSLRPYSSPPLQTFPPLLPSPDFRPPPPPPSHGCGR